MENTKRKPKEWCFRNVIIYSLICCMTLNTSLVSTALALEAVDVISSSGATPTQWGDHTIIDTDHGAILDWSNFNTSAGQSVTFNQFDGGVLSATSAVLNRITSASATQFDGALAANGRVFVVNPAGVIFGSGSTVNVSQLVASGLNMSNDAFNAVLADPANQMVFEGGTGQVINSGVIHADRVYLVGRKVKNSSEVSAPGGLIVLAAGDNVYLAQDGSNVLVQVLADPLDPTADVENRSLLHSPNGTIVLAAGDTFSRAVSSVGVVSAKSGTIRYQAARIESRGRIDVSASSDADGSGGTVMLNGREEVLVGLSEGAPDSAWIKADAGLNGDGGSVTLQSEGTVTVEEGHSISARGGSTSGNGGSVSITAEDFSIAGVIDASPGNADYEPGTLQINTPNVTIENGANAGGTDTIYEQVIETLSDKGTSLVVYSEQGITIPDIVDGEIKGRYGNIELYTTDRDSFVSFVDTSDTISTTLGDIIIGAGSGGLTIGNLETAKDLSDANPTPGQIILSTSSRGNITVENLLIKDGWGHAEINVDASGELTVNGNVIVGGDSPILNIPSGQDAEAMIYLKSGDNMVINGDVTALAHGSNAGIEGGTTKAYIGVLAGTNETWFGDLTINGDLTAKAISTSAGTSEATIEIDSWGSLAWGPEAADPLADGDSAQVHVESKESASDTNADGDIARIIVNTQGNAPTVDGRPDFVTTHMGTFVEGFVQNNDAHPEGELLGALLLERPSHAESFTFDGGGKYSYTPEAGYVGDDTFTYSVSSVEGGPQSDPVLVTITMTNTAPTVEAGTGTTHMGAIFEGTVADLISDPENDQLTIYLVANPTHGELTTKPDATYSYTPQAGYVGDDTFTYSATDGEIGAEPVEFAVTISMTNTAPVAEAGTATTHMNTILNSNIADSISDPEGDPLTTVLVTAPGHGEMTMNLDGTYSYKPEAGYIGDDAFTYSATDGQIGAVPVQAAVTITMTNSPPTADTDVARTTQGTAIPINVLANDLDPDGDPLRISSFTYTGTGTVAINADNTLTYKPGKDFLGKESITYSATDGQIGATPVTTTVEVTVGPAPASTPAELFMPTGPNLDKTDVRISGCPALTKWAAEEIGIGRRRMEIWIVNGLASMRGVQPCDACMNLRDAANILADAEGIHAAAVAQIIDEFGSRTGPMTEEMAAYITNAMALNSDARARYAIAEKYFAALAKYVDVLHNDMGVSIERAAQIVAKKYIDPLAGSGNVGVASYVAARLDSVTMFLTVVRLNRGKEMPQIK